MTKPSSVDPIALNAIRYSRHEHHDDGAQDHGDGGNEQPEALIERLGKRVDIVRHAAENVTERRVVKVFQRQTV